MSFEVTSTEVYSWLDNATNEIIAQLDRDTILDNTAKPDNLVHETVDGLSWLIYTGYHFPLLTVLDDMGVDLDSAYSESGGVAKDFRQGIIMVGFYSLRSMLDEKVRERMETIRDKAEAIEDED